MTTVPFLQIEHPKSDLEFLLQMKEDSFMKLFTVPFQLHDIQEKVRPWKQ